MRTALLFLFALKCTVITAVLPTPVSAADTYPIGTMLHIEGKAYTIKGDNRRELSINDPVYMNTTISTPPGSKALLHLIDDTQITLAEGSELLIDEYVIDPYEPEENRGRFSITKGAFYWISGLISKREDPDVRIRTAMGSIGIRGTQFFAGDIDAGYGVYVFDGEVRFESDFGVADLPVDSGIYLGPKQEELGDAVQWEQGRIDRAIAKVTFARPEMIENKTKEQNKRNVKNRHDYRGQKFPYKPNPYAPRLKVDDDEFFSEEFEEMRRKN